MTLALRAPQESSAALSVTGTKIRQWPRFCASCNADHAAHLWRAPLDKDAASVVALGKFDALHTGHRALAVQASSMGGSPWMVSFSGMAEVMGWPRRPALVAPCDRSRVLQSWQTACMGKLPRQYWIPFDAVRSMSPEEFVQVLARDLQVAGVVVGEGFRFGYRAAGNTDTLRSIGRDLGLVIDVVDLIKLSATSNESPVSSSKVREALAAGRLSQVGAYLDRPHCLVARMSPEDLLRHQGNALGAQYLRRIPLTCFENQAPGKGIYQARVGAVPETCSLDTRQFDGLQRVTVAVTDFGIDIILPATITVAAQDATQLVLIEFESSHFEKKASPTAAA